MAQKGCQERAISRVRCARAYGAEGLSESKLPTLDAALSLVILRVKLGALFVSTFFENLGKELYSAKGYAGLIRYYIQYGHAPAVWKEVMGLMAANSAIAGPGQAVRIPSPPATSQCEPPVRFRCAHQGRGSG